MSSTPIRNTVVEFLGEDGVHRVDLPWERVAHPTQKAVQYAIGAQRPLDMARMQALNLKQYLLVRKTMAGLDALVSGIVAAIDAGDASRRPAPATGKCDL